MEKYYRTAVCPYDCPDSCGLLVETDRKEIFSVKGDPEHPITKGFICRKMQHYERDIHSPERITTPYKRVGNKGSKDSFVPISWDEAIMIISTKWKEIGKNYGYDSILPYSYAGMMGNINRHSGIAFFEKLGAANLERTICSSARGAGENHVMGSFFDWPVEELVGSDLVILWGSNPKVNRLHSVPWIKKAKEKGAKVIMINVCETPSQDLCDEVILVTPGNDAALISAMLNVLDEKGLTDLDFIENYTEGYEDLKKEFIKWTPERASQVCGLSPEKIEGLAIQYGKASKPIIIPGSGMTRYTNGASTFRALLYLPSVTGAWKRHGGTVTAVGSGHFLNRAYINKPEWNRNDVQSINMNQLGLELSKKDSTIKSLYVYHSNPAVMAPDQNKVIQGLMRDDLFTVVHDRFFTDTAVYSDILLPATFSVESDDLYASYGYYHFQAGYKVIPAPGEAKSNWDTFCLLAEAMGFEEDFFRQSESDVLKHLIESDDTFKVKLTPDEKIALKEGKAFLLKDINVMDNFKRGKKINLAPPTDIYFPLKDNKYGLRLVCNNSPWSLNSNFSYNQYNMESRGKITVLLNSEDAKSRGIQDGDMVQVYNDLGRIHTVAKISPMVKQGALIATGVFQKEFTFGDGNFSSLISCKISDSGAASTLNTNTVEVEKAL